MRVSDQEDPVGGSAILGVFGEDELRTVKSRFCFFKSVPSEGLLTVVLYIRVRFRQEALSSVFHALFGEAQLQGCVIGSISDHTCFLWLLKTQSVNPAHKDGISLSFRTRNEEPCG